LANGHTGGDTDYIYKNDTVVTHQIILLMMEAEKGSCPELTRLVARKDFIEHNYTFLMNFALHYPNFQKEILCFGLQCKSAIFNPIFFILSIGYLLLASVIINSTTRSYRMKGSYKLCWYIKK
jgi:hypothetical protein